MEEEKERTFVSRFTVSCGKGIISGRKNTFRRIRSKKEREDSFYILSGGMSMKMSDLSNGPDWVVWIVIACLAILSIILISGHGEWFISGYNTASKEEREKYDSKKLCRTIGAGMAVITILIFFTILFEQILPAAFAYIMAGIILADIVIMMILANTICKKRER